LWVRFKKNENIRNILWGAERGQQQRKHTEHEGRERKNGREEGEKRIEGQTVEG